MDFLATLLVTAVAVYLTALILPGIELQGGKILGPLIVAFVLGIVNALIKPLVIFFSIPLNILTLGLFGLVINGLMLMLASYSAREFTGHGLVIDSVWWAIGGAAIISIVTSVLGVVTS